MASIDVRCYLELYENYALVKEQLQKQETQ